MDKKIKILNAAKITGKIAARTVAAFATLSIVILTLYIVLNSILGTHLGFSHHTVLTKSMEPKISAGSLVFIVNADFNELKVGDVVSFYVDINRDGKKDLVTHNFVTYEFEGVTKRLITRGENTPEDNWRINEDDFLGKCVFSIPEVGKYARYLAHPLGTVNLGINVLIVLIAIPLLSVKNELANCEEDLRESLQFKH